VLPDNVAGARSLAAHLAELGHSSIGVISGPPSLTTTRDRLAGFRMGLEERRIDLPEDLLHASDFTRDGGAHATGLLLERTPGLTAIFALNDVMAIGALSCLRERGIRVPEQVSVAGFDDIPIARDLLPALTTVRVPMAEMGARALALALQPRGSRLRVEHLATELVVRDSTGPARA
jgi:LacI family transcriptional regulator